MARFLEHNNYRWLRLGIVAVLVFLMVTLFGATVYAGVYSGWWTGYAMGNQYNCCGHEIIQGDFANHWYTKCPNDPAASWTNGSRIHKDSPIYQHTANGASWPYYDFYLNDVGDFSCSQGNYWVDVYFGRWRRLTESCTCGGVSGYCSWAQVNSCTDAINFGRHYYTYIGP